MLSHLPGAPRSGSGYFDPTRWPLKLSIIYTLVLWVFQPLRRRQNSAIVLRLTAQGLDGRGRMVPFFFIQLIRLNWRSKLWRPYKLTIQKIPNTRDHKISSGAPQVVNVWRMLFNPFLQFLTFVTHTDVQTKGYKSKLIFKQLILK